MPQCGTPGSSISTAKFSQLSLRGVFQGIKNIAVNSGMVVLDNPTVALSAFCEANPDHGSIGLRGRAHGRRSVLVVRLLVGFGRPGSLTRGGHPQMLTGTEISSAIVRRSRAGSSIC